MQPNKQIPFVSVQSLSRVRDSLRSHGLQHTRLPCSSSSPRARSNSCPLSQWWHPTISSSVVPFSYLLSFPASGSFPMSWLFASGGQSTGAGCLFLLQGIFPLRDQTHVSCISCFGRQVLYHWLTWEAQCFILIVVVQSLSLTRLCNSMACGTPGFLVLHYLPELAQTHVHWVSDAIQPPHPLSSSSPALILSQHQGFFQWISSSHQVAKVLELQHQSF